MTDEGCPPVDAWLVPGAMEDPVLERHIDRCADCREIAAAVARLGILEPEREPSRVELVAELLVPGARVGRYTIRRAIGSGAMGVVLEAHDPQLDRVVALKLVRGLGENTEWGRRARGRIVDEARAMARLAHPNVVAIHELVELGDERLIAMEHVAGRDLAAWIATRPTIAERRRVVGDAGRGLAAIHDAGLIHGDVKPANVLVGDDGRARITDFGLATFAGATHKGGTPRFVAPELAGGRAWDARADQYAFAVTAWWAMFGDFPTPADRDREPAIARVLRRALSDEPEHRFASMHELVAAFEAASRPPRTWIPIAIVAAAAIAVIAMWLARPSQAPACTVIEPAKAPWSADDRARWIAAVGRDTADAGLLADRVDRAWAEIATTRASVCARPDRPLGSEACLQAAVRWLELVVAKGPAAKAPAIARTIDRLPDTRACLVARGDNASQAPVVVAPVVLASLGLYDDAEAALATAGSGELDPSLRGALLAAQVMVRDGRGDRAGAREALERILQLPAFDGDADVRADATVAVLARSLEAGDRPAAEHLAPIATAAVARAAPSRARDAQLANALGVLALDHGAGTEARDAFARAAAIVESTPGSDPRAAAVVAFNSARALELLHQPSEALATYRVAAQGFSVVADTAQATAANLAVARLAGELARPDEELVALRQARDLATAAHLDGEVIDLDIAIADRQVAAGRGGAELATIKALLGRVAATDPRRGSARFVYARALLQAGQPALARDAANVATRELGASDRARVTRWLHDHGL